MDAGDKKNIEHLYLRMYRLMFEYASSVLSSEHLAEEAIQETFRIACQKPEELCASQNPEGWLLRTLKYTISNMTRSRDAANRILKDYFASKLNEMYEAEEAVGVEIMYDDLAELEEFKLLKEMVIDGRSHLEMARDRGISVPTCKKRVQRAKELLRKKLEKN